MSFISINWTSKLSFLPHSLCEYHDLLEKEDGHLLHPVVGGGAGVLGAQEGPPK